MEKETTYGVWAVRSGASIFGRAEAWCKEDGKPLEFTPTRLPRTTQKKKQPNYRKRPLLRKRKGTGTRRRQESPNRHSRIWMPAPMRK